MRDFTFTFIVLHRLCQYPHQEPCFLSGACRCEDSNSKIINCLSSTTSLTRWLSPPVAFFLWNDSVLNPTSLCLTRESWLTTSWELQNSTVEGLVPLFAKSFIFQEPHPLPAHVCVKEGSSQWWPPVLLLRVPRYQVSAALRCWDLKCGELSRWRHYPMAIVTPLADNFYFDNIAFIAQFFYLNSSRFVLLSISELAIWNSLMVLCIIESFCHRNQCPSVVHSVYLLLLGWLVDPSLSCAQNAEQWGQAVSGRNSLVSLLTHDVLF